MPQYADSVACALGARSATEPRTAAAVSHLINVFIRFPLGVPILCQVEAELTGSVDAPDREN